MRPIRRSVRPTFRPLSRWREPGCATRRSLEPVAVGHRVVHGGPLFDRPILVDDDVLMRLERYVSLAPLHQPNNLAPIRAHSGTFSRPSAGRLLRHRLPSRPQPACGPLRDPRALLRGGRAPVRIPRFLVRVRREPAAAGSAQDRGRTRDRCSSGQRRVDVCVVRAVAVSRARWALPRWMVCRWGHGRVRSTPASCCTSSGRSG